MHATFTTYDFLASTTVQNTSSIDNENNEKLIKSKRNSSTERNHKVESEFVTFSAGGGNFGGYRRLLDCLLYASPSPRDQRGSRMPSSA